MFEKPYQFRVTLEVTVYRDDPVPEWRDLVNQFARFFYERAPHGIREGQGEATLPEAHTLNRSRHLTSIVCILLPAILLCPPRRSLPKIRLYMLLPLAKL